MELPLNERIKLLRRQQLGLPRKDFADPLGISEGVLYLIEKGKTKNVPMELLKSICDTYKCDWNWLTKGEGQPFNKGQSESGEVLHLSSNGYEKGGEKSHRPASTDPAYVEYLEKQLEADKKEIEEWKRRYDKLSEAFMSIRTQGGQLKVLGKKSLVWVDPKTIN